MQDRTFHCRMSLFGLLTQQVSSYKLKAQTHSRGLDVIGDQTLLLYLCSSEVPPACGVMPQPTPPA